MDVKLNYPGAIVTFKVGPNAKNFIVHKEFVTKASTYFEELYKSTEELSSTYVLDKTTEETARELIHWLYNDTFDEDICQGEVTDDVVELWILGRDLKMTRLQDEAIDILYTWWYDTRPFDEVDTSVITYAYANTEKGSPLRQFLVDLGVAYFDSWAIKNCLEENLLPADFVNELLCEFCVTLRESMELTLTVTGVINGSGKYQNHPIEGDKAEWKAAFESDIDDEKMDFHNKSHLFGGRQF